MLVLAGARDDVVPASSSVAFAKARGADLCVFAGKTHNLTSDPDCMQQTCAWIRDQLDPKTSKRRYADAPLSVALDVLDSSTPTTSAPNAGAAEDVVEEAGGQHSEYAGLLVEMSGTAYRGS